ncbi:MAG: DUF488 family protein [Thermomicrobiales bacterium]
MPSIAIQRIYDNDTQGCAGKRILVDRLWPRGVTRERAAVELWLKDVAPSTALRKAFHHGGALTWTEFRRRYIHEIQVNPAPFELLMTETAAGPVVLLYSSRETEQNHAVILRDLLRARLDETSDCAECIW